MTAFQLQTFVPADGIVSITLPEIFREGNVDMFIAKKKVEEPQKMGNETHLAWMEKFRGSLHSVDYSDLREETDREI